MTSTGPFGAHGFTFRITSPVIELVDTFDDVLVDLRLDEGDDRADHVIDIDPVAGGRSDRAVYRVRVDGEPVHDTLIEGSVVSHVLMEINRRVTESVWSTGSIALHASVVAGPGGAVVLAGASHSGKTTLAAALALAGDGRFTFLADEVCALDPGDLTVAPYGKPAALRAPGLDLLAPRVDRLRRPGTRFERDERFVSPRELGRRPIGPCPVTAIVFPRYVGAQEVTEDGLQSSDTGLATVGPVDALTRLMRLTLGDHPLGTEAFRTVEQLVRNVAVHDLRHGDAVGAAGRLARLLDDGDTR